MALRCPKKLKKSVCVGLGLTGGSSPVPSSLTDNPGIGFSFWFVLGNPYRQLLRVDSFPFSPLVAPRTLNSDHRAEDHQDPIAPDDMPDIQCPLLLSSHF